MLSKLQLDNVNKILENKESHYKIYHIKKIREDGSTKIRRIISPSEFYREVLKTISEKLYLHKSFDIHDSCYAWVKNRSIKDCLSELSRYPVVIQFDITNYFDNILKSHVEELFNEKGYSSLFGLERDKFIDLITLNIEEKEILAQGFPTSPYFANAVKYKIDAELTKFGYLYGLKYVNYGDNLFFCGKIPSSYNEILNKKVKSIVNKYGFDINTDKTLFMPHNKKQEIMGATVNTRPSFSKKYYEKTLKTLLKEKASGSISRSTKGRIAYMKSLNYNRNIKYLEKLIKETE